MISRDINSTLDSVLSTNPTHFVSLTVRIVSTGEAAAGVDSTEEVDQCATCRCQNEATRLCQSGGIFSFRYRCDFFLAHRGFLVLRYQNVIFSVSRSGSAFQWSEFEVQLVCSVGGDTISHIVAKVTVYTTEYAGLGPKCTRGCKV